MRINAVSQNGVSRWTRIHMCRAALFINKVL
nr:MAG TPA: hypothetical protein [Caudoviricetes sp.]